MFWCLFLLLIQQRNESYTRQRLRKACKKRGLISTAPNASRESCSVLTMLHFTAPKIKVFYSCASSTSTTVDYSNSNFETFSSRPGRNEVQEWDYGDLTRAGEESERLSQGKLAGLWRKRSCSSIIKMSTSFKRWMHGHLPIFCVWASLPVNVSACVSLPFGHTLITRKDCRIQNLKFGVFLPHAWPETAGLLPVLWIKRSRRLCVQVVPGQGCRIDQPWTAHSDFGPPRSPTELAMITPSLPVDLVWPRFLARVTWEEVYRWQHISRLV